MMSKTHGRGSETENEWLAHAILVQYIVYLWRWLLVFYDTAVYQQTKEVLHAVHRGSSALCCCCCKFMWWSSLNSRLFEANFDVFDFHGQSFLYSKGVSTVSCRYIRATSIVRSNKEGIPYSLAMLGKKGAKFIFDILGAELGENGMVIVLTWMNIALVQTITTVQELGPERTVNRVRNWPRLT